jgi:hypothetical protein
MTHSLKIESQRSQTHANQTSGADRSESVEERARRQANLLHASSNDTGSTGLDDDNTSLVKLNMSPPELEIDDDDDDIKTPEAMPMIVSVRVSTSSAPKPTPERQETGQRKAGAVGRRSGDGSDWRAPPTQGQSAPSSALAPAARIAAMSPSTHGAMFGAMADMAPDAASGSRAAATSGVGRVRQTAAMAGQTGRINSGRAGVSQTGASADVSAGVGTDSGNVKRLIEPTTSAIGTSSALLNLSSNAASNLPSNPVSDAASAALPPIGEQRGDSFATQAYAGLPSRNGHSPCASISLDKIDGTASTAESAAMHNPQRQTHVDAQAALSGKARTIESNAQQPRIPAPPGTEADARMPTNPEVTYRFKSWGGDASVNLRLDSQSDSKIVLAMPSDDRVRRILDASLFADAGLSTQLRLDDRESGAGDERRARQLPDDQQEDEDAA